jgi:hypothetical protein
MMPKQTISAAGQVVAEMGRQLRSEKKMSLEGVKVFTALLKSYAEAVESARGGTAADLGGDDIMQTGRPRAYEEMVDRAVGIDRAREAKRKKD